MASAGGDWKAMYHAAQRGDAACVRFHLSEGVDVEYQHPEAMVSALVIAVVHGHAEVVEVLLQHGADPNAPAQLGPLTPLQAAEQAQRPDLYQRLLQRGARPPSWTARCIDRLAVWRRWLPL